MKFIGTIQTVSAGWLPEKLDLRAAKSSINGAQLVTKHSIQWIYLLDIS